jgi:16S rRNA (guanine966-N2)-methyltransferase
VREALASALESRGAFDGARVLDLFAGTGALSFEALSRGAAGAVVVDRDPRTIRQITQSATELGLGPEVRPVRVDLLGDPASAIAKLPATDEGFSLVFVDAPYSEIDLVFVDAPYSEIDSVRPLLDALVASERLTHGAWVVIEYPAACGWTWPNGLAPDADYRYGQTGISLGVYAAEKGRQ